MEITRDESQAERLRVPPRWLVISGLILLQTLGALWHLTGLQWISVFDPAHYYVVAKNIAHGMANPDNVLWHYLGKNLPIERPAGDYWGAGWPYALGYLMRWSGGESPLAAFRICAVLSVFLPVTVFLLLERLTPRWWVAAFGAVLVCLQTQLFRKMVVPDVTLSYQLITTAGFALLLGVLGDRPSLMRLLPSAFVLTLPIWLRGEGFIPPLAASLGLLAATWPWKQRLICVFQFAALVGICLFPYVLYNLHCFGRITPGSQSLTPLMTDFKQLYEFRSIPSWEDYCKLGVKGIVGLRLEALAYFANGLWQNMPYLLLLLGTLGPPLRYIASRRAAGRVIACADAIFPSRTSGASSSRPDANGRQNGCGAAGIMTLWSFVILSVTVPILVVPVVATYGRFLMNTTPVLCVLAVWTIEPLLRYRWTVNLALLFVAAILLTYVYWPFHLRRPWTTGWKDRYLNIPACLSPGNHPALNAADTVLTEMPCELSATLGVKSIMAPWDDTIIDESAGAENYQRFLPSLGYKRKVISPEACRQVIEHYHPRFILAFDGSILDQCVNRLKDLPLRVVSRGQNQDGHGYTWYEVAEGAQWKP